MDRRRLFQWGTHYTAVTVHPKVQKYMSQICLKRYICTQNKHKNKQQLKVARRHCVFDLCSLAFPAGAPGIILVLSLTLTCTVPACRGRRRGCWETQFLSPVCCTHLPNVVVQLLLQPGSSASGFGFQQHVLALLGSIIGTGKASWFSERCWESLTVLQCVLGVLHGISVLGSSFVRTLWHAWMYQLTSYWEKHSYSVLFLISVAVCLFPSIDHFCILTFLPPNSSYLRLLLIFQL